MFPVLYSKKRPRLSPGRDIFFLFSSLALPSSDTTGMLSDRVKTTLKEKNIYWYLYV